jgi:hypothetical protein
MSRSEPNRNAPPSPDDLGLGDVLSLGLVSGSRLTLLPQAIRVSPGSQMHPLQPHVHASPPICVWPASATELNGPNELALLANAGDNTTSITTAQKYADTLESFILWPPEKGSGAMRRVGLNRAILLNVFRAAKDIEAQSRTLIRLAEIAYGARDYAALNEIRKALLAIPCKPAQNAATYYHAVLFKRAGQLDQAAALLADLHQPRALLTLATLYESKGEWAEAMRLHVEVMRRAKDADVFAFVCSAMQLAMVRAIDGDHANALKGFQSLSMIVRAIANNQPYVYPAWCNAMAVELAATGRIEEARAASAVAMVSPIARAYPEWQETAAEIAEPQSSRAIVTVALPQAETDTPPPRLPLLIQHRLASPRRLPLAPPSPIPARLLSCAPVHGPPSCCPNWFSQ